MITCDLIGQTGNQMFQIATTMAMALDNNDTYLIPEYSVNRQLWPLHYRQLPKLTPEDRAKVEYTHREPRDFCHHHIPYHPNMLLHGYFQSEKYFAHRRREVIDLFKQEWKPDINVWSELKSSHILVGVHVRRGDYLQHSTKFMSPTGEWLEKAMHEMIKQLHYRGDDHSPSNQGPAFSRGIVFIFFSDDIQWCRDQFGDKLKPFNIPINYSDGRSALDEMALLASMEHQIISASTFGWWGAWMNENPDKLVIAPRVWFGPDNSHLNYKDVIPTTWIKM